MPHGIRNTVHSILRRRTLDPITGCRTWDGYRNRDGYGVVKWDGSDVLVHIFVFDYYNPGIRNGRQVLHTCDNPPCSTRSHLFAGIDQDNKDDMVAKGRSLTGDRNPMAKLNEKQVRRIRILYSRLEISQHELGRIFKISNQHVSDLVNYKRRAGG